MTTPKTQQQIDDARDWMRRIRLDLEKVDDVLSHAGGFRSGAFNDSLMCAWQHVESARIHAVQVAAPKLRD
jgi:hypothetical protein